MQFSLFTLHVDHDMIFIFSLSKSKFQLSALFAIFSLKS